MKWVTATALFALAALVTARGVMAQDRAVRAFVPFDFSADDKTLPSGNYEIWARTTDVVETQNREKNFATLTRTSFESHGSTLGSKLVFDQYGNHYFLSEVLCAPAALSVSLPPSRSEKRIRTHQAGLVTPTQVFVAAR